VVAVAAGERWHDLVRWSLARGLAGLENLALIPGSVGAAPVQNIGAYGVELGDLVQQVEALELPTGRLVRLSADDCGFAYRDSLFKREPGRFVISEVTLLLGTPDHEPVIDYPDVALELDRMGIARPGPQAVAEAVIRVRRRKLPDPRFVPNAGSFFKNPVVDRETFAALEASHGPLRSYPAEPGRKLAAAQLIERCGFKADEDGAVRVWQRQPLVLTNPGRRPASEVLAYAERIRSAVAATFGVRLEFEPDRFGC
jgi:UDP-N-acetylmuramate dehydrogenase